MMKYRTWVEVDTSLIKKNIEAIKARLSPGVRFCAVVKSNAYGHHLHRFAKEAVLAGADFIAVDSITEAFALRSDGARVPMLVLGYTLPIHYIAAAEKNISITVSSAEQIETVRDSGVCGLRIHLKLDTGMHRQGFERSALVKVLPRIVDSVASGAIIFEGVYTHLASAKAREYSAASLMQKERFEEMLASIKGTGLDQGIVHAVASGGALMYPDMHYDMVRIGMSCYGCWPAAEVKILKDSEFDLFPVLAWKSLISEVKNVARGERVGYDGTHILSRESVLAVVPIGYWHGYDRALGGKASVIVRGSRAPVLGRVSMDMIVIDVTDISGVSARDEVTLIGRDGPEVVTAEELAGHADTTAYEILTRINPLIERIYS